MKKPEKIKRFVGVCVDFCFPDEEARASNTAFIFEIYDAINKKHPMSTSEFLENVEITADGYGVLKIYYAESDEHWKERKSINDIEWEMYNEWITANKSTLEEIEQLEQKIVDLRSKLK